MSALEARAPLESSYSWIYELQVPRRAFQGKFSMTQKLARVTLTLRASGSV